MQIYWTKINQIIEESAEVKTYMLDCPEGFTWEEGSHTHFALEGFNADEKPNRSLIRHMSISTLPHEDPLVLPLALKSNALNLNRFYEISKWGMRWLFSKPTPMYR
ncbi:hypothetical protein JCM19047_4491 [Bacillus sp. JCM 19047]|nr:hypothetical protein JCM19047_4491 [Bacillus sp. JCM 19047]